MLKLVDLETADQLLAALDPARGGLWEENRASLSSERAWIFRGVWDAQLPLVPAAFRPSAFDLFAPPGLEHVAITTPKEQRDWEDHVIVQFCSEADRLGFLVPGDRPELRDPRHAIPDYDAHRFPPIEKLHMYALAQHYGVPTRLLDWTRRPLVAAYFAVEKVTRLEKDVAADHRCAVWALDEGFIGDMAKRSVKKDTDDPEGRSHRLNPDIFIVTAPTASNPNLSAQGGVFTLVQPRTGDPHPIPTVTEALETIGANIDENDRRRAPYMLKFTLPAKQARLALRLLSSQRVHAATIRPGLASIVEMYREKKHHHRVEAPPLVTPRAQQSDAEEEKS